MHLPEAVAAPDALVVRLETVGESHKDHLMAVLEIHPKAGNAWLGNEYPHPSVLKGFQSRKLGIRGVAALDLDALRDAPGEAGALLIESAPDDPLSRVGLHQRYRVLNALVESALAGAEPVANPAQPRGKECAIGPVARFHNNRCRRDRRQHIAGSIKAQISGSFDAHRPGGHPAIERHLGMFLQA